MKQFDGRSQNRLRSVAINCLLVASTHQALCSVPVRVFNGNMKHQTTPHTGYGPIINRFEDVMEHVTRFNFKGVRRLAHEAGVSPSTVSRLINNKLNPSFALVARLTAAVEAQLGFRIDPRDLIAESGAFFTPSICDLVGCSGCLPQAAQDEFGATKPAFSGVQPGTWVTSRYPRGFAASEQGARD